MILAPANFSGPPACNFHNRGVAELLDADRMRVSRLERHYERQNRTRSFFDDYLEPRRNIGRHKSCYCLVWPIVEHAAGSIMTRSAKLTSVKLGS